QISNEHYDTPTGLADIAGPRYGVFWIFIHFDSDLHVVYGTGSYKLAEAEMATVPPLPAAVSEFSALAAKIIVGSADPNFTSIVTAYETLFPVSTPPDHDDLGGIVADNHHARYIDAESAAVAAALIVIHAAIADAHHAAFVLADHTAIGDNAPHHARYTDAEALAVAEAIGVAAGLIGVHAGLPAVHHARYADAEAVTAAKTVKLDDFATPDDNADLNASTTRHGLFKKLDNVINHFLNGKGNWIEVVAGPTIATGSYLGNETDNRQIATGF
ncbi:unnamed protein product, partial [marine sediment metagenome]